MTVNDTLAAIEVMKAFTEGKKIELQERGTFLWRPIINCEMPSWDWHRCIYRVKPPDPPNPVEFWILKNSSFGNCEGIFSSREKAESYKRRYGMPDCEVIHLLEVPS